MDEELAIILLQCGFGCCCLLMNLLIIVGAMSIASGKNRNPIVWGALAFFFSFPALLVLLLLPANQPAYPPPYQYAPPPNYAAPPPAYAPPHPPPPTAYTAPPPPPVRPSPSIHETMLHSGPRLAIIAGPDSGQNYGLGQQTRLGRNPDNEIVLSDPQASRHHAMIQRQGQKYIINDLGSGNGVFVNGKRISEATPLTAGDVIAIGNTQFRFE